MSTRDEKTANSQHGSTADIQVIGAFLDKEETGGDWRKVIRRLGSLLVEADCAEPSYIDDVLAREHSYPTGLELPDFGVALPHGDPDHAISQGIAVGRLLDAVPFQRMDDARKSVDATFVFMLAVADPEGHLTTLSKLMDVIGSDGRRNALLVAQSPDDLAKLVRSYLMEE